MEQRIKVLQITPRAVPRTMFLQTSIEAFNNAVSIGAYEPGIAASIRLEDNIYLLYYKDGFFAGLSPNRRVKGRILFGIFYVVATDKETIPRSLTEIERKKYFTQFNCPEEFSENEAMQEQLKMLSQALDQMIIPDTLDFE